MASHIQAVTCFACILHTCCFLACHALDQQLGGCDVHDEHCYLLHSQSLVQTKHLVAKNSEQPLPDLPDADTIDMVMIGGKKHNDGDMKGAAKKKTKTPWGAGVFPGRSRPQWAKSVRCLDSTDDTCQECWDVDYNCWTGVTKQLKEKGGGGINVDGTGAWTRFKYVTHVHCESDAIFVQWAGVKLMENGILYNYWDGTEITTSNGFDLKGDLVVSPMRPETHGKGDKKKSFAKGQRTLLTLRDLPHGGHEIVAEFIPVTIGIAQAFLEMRIFVDKTFRVCEDHQVCLQGLGNMKELESRHLRNSNAAQKACLETPYSDTKDACRKWRKCLQDTHLGETNHEITLMNMLDAAGVQPGGEMSLMQQGESSCLNPATEDPESWDCDCYVDMKDICQRVQDRQEHEDYTDATCFRAIFCNTERVCDFWKASFCSDPSVVAIGESLQTLSFITTDLHNHDALNTTLLSRDEPIASISHGQSDLEDKKLWSRQTGLSMAQVDFESTDSALNFKACG